MKRILTSETFLGIVTSIIITLMFFFAFLRATAPEQWYASMHDSQCEKTLSNEPCKCYERLVAANKARCNK